MFEVVLSSDFQFGSKRKAKHMKIECMGCKPDRAQSVRQSGAVMGWAAHRGGREAHSRVYSRPASLYVVLDSLLFRIS